MLISNQKRRYHERDQERHTHDNACIKIVNYDNYTHILAKLNLSYVSKKRWQNKNLTATPRGIA